MRKNLVASLLTCCLLVTPLSISASETNIYDMSLEELQQAYLTLQEKYEALINENSSDVKNSNTALATSIETGNFIFTLDSVIQCSSISGSFSDRTPEDPENVFLIFKITAENIGTEDDYINIFYSSGYVDGYAIDPSTILSSNLESFAGDIAAGRKRSGDIVFEVPSNWEEFEYLYYEKYQDIKASYIVTPDVVTAE